MKVIDWLLKVSNGEIHEDTEFKINGEKIEGIKDLGEYKILSKELLNSIVEIIEEDKKIRKVGLQEDGTFRVPSMLELASKVNEIIDYLEEKE